MITYNHQDYIKDAISGVLKQDFNLGMELVISDDCSTDSTIEIIKQKIRLNKNPNIKIRLKRNSKNIGVNRNFINALNSCEGKYIAICEGDDFWLDPCKIRKQFNFLENNLDFILSFHNTKVIKNGKIIKEKKIGFLKKDELCYSDLVKGIYTIPTLTSFFRNIIKNKLPKEFEKVTNCDTFLFLFLSQYGKLFFDREIVNVYHVIHDKGIWSSLNSLEQSKKSYETYHLALKYFQDKNLYIPLVNFGNAVIINSLKTNNFTSALKYYFLNIISSFKNSDARKIFLTKQLEYSGKNKSLKK